MELKDLVTSGIKNKPPRIIFYGTQKIGKSSLGCSAPTPIFLPTEDGLTNIDVAQFPLAKTYEDVLTYMWMIINNEHEYKTFVIDTVDWLETLIWNKMCVDDSVDTIEQTCGGCGKGYKKALIFWTKILNGLEKIREKGMIVILLAHSDIKTCNNPDSNPYDKYKIKLHKLASEKLVEWADAILFIHKKIYVNKENNVGKAIGGERVIYTNDEPAWTAGNRYNLPPEIPFAHPFDFNKLLTLIKK